MAEGAGRRELDRGERAVEIRVGARLENLAVMRTVVGAVSTFEDLDVDAVADLRLAVDEACTALIRAAVPGSDVCLLIDPRADTVVIRVSVPCTDAPVIGDFSWHVLRSLTDEVSTFTDGDGPDAGRVVGITMTARRVSLLR